MKLTSGQAEIKKSGPKQEALFLVSVVFIALAMRAPLSCIGPLVSFFKADLGLGPAASGLLTTIPLVAFSLMSPIAGKLTSMSNGKTFIVSCLLLVMAASLTRSYLGLPGLFLGTAFLGAAIGGLNVAMPVLIRGRQGIRLGFSMGIFSTAMAFSSALASGFSIPVSHLLGNWRNGIVLFSLPAVAATVLWYKASGSLNKKPSGPVESLFRGVPIKTFLSLPLFMGLQSFVFFSMVMWLTSMLVSQGYAAEQAALLLFAVQVIGILPNFFYPIAVEKSKNKGRLAVLAALMYVLGFLLVFFQNGIATTLLAVFLLGFGNGMSISMCLTLIALKGKNREETAKISAFTQMIGYAIAAPGPLVLGAVSEMTGGWTAPLLILVMIAILMGIVGRKAGNATNPPLALTAS